MKMKWVCVMYIKMLNNKWVVLLWWVKVFHLVIFIFPLCFVTTLTCFPLSEDNNYSAFPHTLLQLWKNMYIFFLPLAIASPWEVLASLDRRSRRSRLFAALRRLSQMCFRFYVIHQAHKWEVRKCVLSKNWTVYELAVYFLGIRTTGPYIIICESVARHFITSG